MWVARLLLPENVFPHSLQLHGFSPVPRECASFREGLSTLLATVWLLPCANSYVNNQAVPCRECLHTVFATVWLLSCVSSCQLAIFREGFLMLLESVWSMSSHVLCQVAMLRECFPTLLAPVWLHVCLLGNCKSKLKRCPHFSVWLVLYPFNFFERIVHTPCSCMALKMSRRSSFQSLCCVGMTSLVGNPQEKRQSRIFPQAA